MYIKKISNKLEEKTSHVNKYIRGKTEKGNKTLMNHFSKTKKNITTYLPHLVEPNCQVSFQYHQRPAESAHKL